MQCLLIRIVPSGKRLFHLLILFLSLVTWPGVAKETIQQESQNLLTTQLSIQLENVPLKAALQAISRKTQVRFVYNPDMIRASRLVSVSATDKTLAQVLEQLLSGTELTYQLLRRGVAIVIKAGTDGVLMNPTVTGKVTDAQTQTPLPGVNVLIKGTNVGTTTNSEGYYTISVPDENSVLVFSYIGYDSQELPVTGKSTIDIALVPGLQSLNEVVVIGYGNQQKANVTGAIGQIKFDEIKDQPVVSFDQALVGKLAGVQVLQTTGEPGRQTTFRVRGVKSITAGNEPLIVLDGIPLERQEQATELANITDIVSIEVLKDASAAAIYGSRGANGVILISTKQGEKGQLKVNYASQIGWQQVSRKIDMLDAYAYAALAKAGHDNAYLDEVKGSQPTDPDAVRPQGYHRTPPELYPYLESQPGLTNTDWQEAIFRSAPLQNHSLTFSGGTDKIKYYLSGNYTDQAGTVIHSAYKRYAARLNLTVTESRLQVGLNLSPSYSVENRINAYGPNGDQGVIASALQMSPTWPVYNADGSFNYQGNGYWRIGTDYQHNEVLNPVALASLINNKFYHVNLLGRAFLEYELIKGLRYQVSLGTTLNNYQNEYYRPSTLPNLGAAFYDKPSNPTASASATLISNWINEHTLSYDQAYGGHHLTLLAGFSAQKNASNWHSATATNFPNDLVQTLNGGQVVSGSGEINAWSLLSGIGRIQYDYQDKYLLSAALRTDGSSRFGKNNKWGYFPSVSAGWRLSAEDFMQKVGFISNLKLRASYGKTGNFQIGNYEQVARIGSETYILGTGGGQLVNGLTPVSIANDQLGWEKTAMLNAGMELGFFNQRLTLEMDWYNSNTSDLLLNMPIPTVTGFSTARQNRGKVNNRGLEITLATQHRFGSTFGWNASANFSTNQNEVKNLGPGNTPIISTAGTTNTFFITQVGSPIGSYYLLQSDGVFKNQADLDTYPHFTDAKPGDFKFVDVSGDGKLDVNDDRTLVGNYFPKFTYGFSSNFTLKGLDLGITLQGVEGVRIVNLLRRYIANMEGNFNNTTAALNRWQSEGQPGDGLTNRANRKAKGNNGRTSTWHVEDGSYLRLQNVTLGYSFPQSLIRRIHLNSLRLYVSGQNLVTWTKYTGYNPEVSLYNSNALTPGVDYGTYPLSKTYSCGLNIGF